MKKTFVAVVLCMALLSSFTLSASAEFSSSDSQHLNDSRIYLQNLWGELNPNLSSAYSTNLRKIVGQILSKLPSSDYAGVLTSRASFNNSSYSDFVVMLGQALTSIYNSNSGIAQRVVEVQSLISGVSNRLDTSNSRLSSIDSHIGSASALNHSDFQYLFDELFYPGRVNSSTPTAHAPYVVTATDGTVDYNSFGTLITFLTQNLFSDLPYSGWGGDRTLYGLIHQLKDVLASDDDLALKKDNKANEDAATDAFVNGNSSKTSLGTGDIGNLKDVGGTFNDLTSLNGQSSVSSFLSGLTSADGTGQGWFSEATRASLDAVSTPVTTTKLVRKTWRGEKSLTYSISADTSLNVVASPAPSRAPVADSDPYNMSGFDDNYNWLWGDAS